jgi:hypothetical protein
MRTQSTSLQAPASVASASTRPACSTPVTAATTPPAFPRVLLRLRRPFTLPVRPAERDRAAPPAQIVPPVPPDGVTAGGFCLAFGLHAGAREQFKAKLLRVRATPPEFLVRYISDVDGKTNALCLPETRQNWLMAHEIEPWTNPDKRAPTAAKTRGQISDRDAPIESTGGRRRAGGPTKRVRFSDEVVIIPYSA